MNLDKEAKTLTVTEQEVQVFLYRFVRAYRFHAQNSNPMKMIVDLPATYATESGEMIALQYTMPSSEGAEVPEVQVNIVDKKQPTPTPVTKGRVPKLPTNPIPPGSGHADDLHPRDARADISAVKSDLREDKIGSVAE